MSNLSYQAVFEVGRLYQAYVNEVNTIRRTELAEKLQHGHPNEDPKLRMIRRYQRCARVKPGQTQKVRKPYHRLFGYHEF